MSVVALLCCSVVGVWGALRDSYCFGGSNPNHPLTLPPIPSEFSELRMLQIVTRHGARTPLILLPGISPNWTCAETSLSVLSSNYASSSSSSSSGNEEVVSINRLYRKVYLDHESYQNCAFGQLTMLGAQQHSMIGKGLRDALVTQWKFLPESLNKTDIYVRSTDYERTQQSAQSLLLSLYPPASSSSSSSISVIDINTVTGDEEDMVPNYDNCPYLQKLQIDILNTPQWQQSVKNLQPTIAILERLLGAAPDDVKGRSDWLESAADTFSMMECHNTTLPPFLSESLRQNLYQAMDLNWFLLYNNSMFSELALGGFLLTLHTNMEMYVNSVVNTSLLPPSFAASSNAEFRLYSGHDTTLAPLLGALGIASRFWIPLASQVVFQLVQTPNLNTSASFAVRVLFNGVPLSLPGCSKEPCLWPEWATKMKQLQTRLETANMIDDICHSVAVDPPCRDIITILRDYSAWWPLLTLLLLSCLVIIGCAFRIRRLKKTEQFRPVEMAEISESR